MRTVIIDDKAPTREKLKKLLKLYTTDIEVIAEADGVESGLACIQQYAPDLVMLDVEMGDGTGFDLMALCPNPEFHVIFITAHDAYAIRAFRFSAIDYILKPVDPEDLMRAVEKAKAQHSIGESQLAIKALVSNQQQEPTNQRLLLADTENIYLIGIDEIIRCESEGNYTHFFLTEDRKLFIAKTLKEYADLLDHPSFFRAHRSHLINLNHFSRLEKKDGGIIHMKDGSILPVAVRRKDSLLNALKSL